MRFKTGKNKTIKEQIREEKTEIMVKNIKNHQNEKISAITTVFQDDATECKTNNELENFHNDQCKTCVRMRNIMGSIMPHPINV